MSTSSDNSKEDDVMLPGFRFHPTDEELVGFYLRRKVEKKPLSIEIIKQVDIYKYDPWDLPMSTMGDNEWYFFCIRGRKYRNSIRPNRVTRSGFWKATGIDKPIYSAAAVAVHCIGLKKSLVYYRGCAGKGTKTDWMMHEFRQCNNYHSTAPTNIAQEAEVWTLCRIFKRNASLKNYAPEKRKASSQQNNPNDAGSKTGSMLDSTITDHYMSLGDERKPAIHLPEGHERDDDGLVAVGLPEGHERDDDGLVVVGRRRLLQQQSWVGEGAPSRTPCSSLVWNVNGGDEFFGDGNWDDLRSVVELAIDPSNIYECSLSIDHN